MNIPELKEFDQNIQDLSSDDRIWLFATYATSNDVLDDNLKKDIVDLYTKIVSFNVQKEALGITNQQLIEKSGIGKDGKEFLVKYINDFNYILGLGGSNEKSEKNNDAPVNQPENIKNVKSLAGILFAIVAACSPLVDSALSEIHDQRHNKIEEIKIEQRNRELDQKDRELDIQEKNIKKDDKP